MSNGVNGIIDTVNRCESINNGQHSDRVKQAKLRFPDFRRIPGDVCMS